VWALWVEAWARRHAEELGAPLRQTAEVWRSDLQDVLDRGQRAGAFSPPPASFSGRLIALMNGFGVQILERVVRRDEVIETVLEQCRLELGRDGSKKDGVPSGRRRARAAARS
jgi:hypothetical protein